MRATTTGPARAEVPALRGEGMRVVRESGQSPVERDRDRAIERKIVRDGRALDDLGIVAHQHGPRWEVEILDRLDLLARLDARGRDAAHEDDRTLSKELAAWVRGIERGQCPEIFIWQDEHGQRTICQRGTIERAASRRRGRS